MLGVTKFKSFDQIRRSSYSNISAVSLRLLNFIPTHVFLRVVKRLLRKDETQ